MSDNFWDNKSDADVVHEISLDIEELLRNQFGARARYGGLMGLAKSVEKKITKKCYDQIRELAEIRNPFQHEDREYLKKGSNRDKFIELGQNIIQDLNRLALRLKFPTEFKEIWVDHEIFGIRIHFGFSVKNLRNINCQAVAYFSFLSGDRLEEENEYSPYRTNDGQVCVRENFIPPYEDTYWDDFTMFIPYSEFPLPKGESHNLRFVIALHNLDDGCKFADSDTKPIKLDNPPPYRESTYSSQYEYVAKKRTASWFKFPKWLKFLEWFKF